MDEELDLATDRFPNSSDLIKGELPLKDNPAGAKTLVEPGLLRSADGALGGGMRLHVILSGAKNLKNSQVLGDHSIHPGLGGFAEKTLSLKKF